MNEIKNLNGYSFVDTQVRESINTLTEQISGLSEEMGAAVKSVNGVMPDENGNVQATETIRFVDYSKIIPGTILKPAGQYSILELVQKLFNGNERHRMDWGITLLDPATGLQTDRYFTHFEQIVTGSKRELTGARMFYGDEYCPIILDGVNDTVTFDPDWVAPAARVKTVNDVEPNENGNVKIPTVDVVQFMDMTGFGGGIQCNIPVEEAWKTKTGDGTLVVYRRIWLGDNDGNPTDAYTSTIIRESNYTTKQYKVDFNDNRAPIIVDGEANTIAIDPDWVKPEENIQPNWNQNDPNATDYVKNRTHWVETKRETVVKETATTGASGQFIVIKALKTDGKYIVNYNDTEYECMPKTDPSGELALGNLSIAKSTLENSGEPFLLTGMSNANVTTYALFADKAGTHVFAAFEVIETVHTIDEKYIPSTVARKSDLDRLEVMPETTEAHKQLVTDAEGKMAWEDKLAYSTLEEQIFIEEAVWDGTQLVFPVSVVNANDGDRIIVYIDGVAYPGVAGNVNPFNIEVIFDEGVKCPWQPNASMKFYVSVPGMSMNLGGQPLSWCVGTMYATIMAEKHHPIRQEYLGVNVKAGENNTGVIVGGNSLSVASGDYSVSLSGGTATGSYSTAIGGYAQATYSFAQGDNSFAKGRASSAFGNHTVSIGENSMAMGKYNIKDEESKYIFIVGNGTQGTEYIDGQGWNHTYSNAHTLDWDGNAWYQGDVYVGGTSQTDGSKLVTEEQVAEKVSLPKLASGIDHGTAGQFAVSDGMGGIMWKTLFEVEEVGY